MRQNAWMRYGLVGAAALVVGLLVAGTPWRSMLPLLLLLACPLMMVFMMRGMGGHGGHGGGPGQQEHTHGHADRDDDSEPRRRL